MMISLIFCQKNLQSPVDEKEVLESLRTCYKSKTCIKDKAFVPQIWFQCKTCTANNALKGIKEPGYCLTCAINCHQNHSLELKISLFNCDCECTPKS